MMTCFVRQVRKRFDEEITRTVTAIGNRSAKDWEDYRRMTGRVAGLKTALDILNDEFKQHNEIDFEEE